MRTIILFLGAGHLLGQGAQRRFRLDKDDPALSHAAEYLLAQRAWRFFALLGNRLYPDVKKVR